MPKAEKVELEKRDIILYKGDWNELATILKSKRITPTFFIRELVHRKLAQIKAAAQDTHQTVEIDDVELGNLGELTSDDADQSAGEGQPRVA